MGLAMNRFYLMPKSNPEFKMAQPLPAFFEISNAKHDPAAAPEALEPGLRQNILTILPAGAKLESFTAVRNVIS